MLMRPGPALLFLCACSLFAQSDANLILINSRIWTEDRKKQPEAEALAVRGEPFPRLARPGPSKSERGPALPSSMGMDAASYPASTTRMSTSTREAHRSLVFSFATRRDIRVSRSYRSFREEPLQRRMDSRRQLGP